MRALSVSRLPLCRTVAVVVVVVVKVVEDCPGRELLSEVEKGDRHGSADSSRSSSSTQCSARSIRRLSHSAVSYGQSCVV